MQSTCVGWCVVIRESVSRLVRCTHERKIRERRQLVQRQGGKEPGLRQRWRSAAHRVTAKSAFARACGHQSPHDMILAVTRNRLCFWSLQFLSSRPGIRCETPVFPLAYLSYISTLRFQVGFLKGGPEPLEKESHEFLGSKRDDRFSNPFF